MLPKGAFTAQDCILLSGADRLPQTDYFEAPDDKLL